MGDRRDRIGWRLLTAAASLGALLILWRIAAVFADPLVLPAPEAVFAVAMKEAASGALFLHVGATLARVAAAFVIATAIGAAVGLFLGMNRRADRLFDPWVILLLNLPALVVIVLAYIWLGLTEAAAVAAVALNKIPNVVVTMREGARALDPMLAEMARVYRFGPRRTLVHVIAPQLQPYFAAACRSGLALIWKIVLVVELLGRPNGVGFQIYTHFQLFDVATILAYALTFVGVMLLAEILFIQPQERRAARWRGAA